MANWLIIIISLLFSAFFSGMEIAFVSSNKLRFELDKKNKVFSASLLNVFYKHPQQYISTMLVGNNIALVVYGIKMAEVLGPVIRMATSNEILVSLIQTILATILVLFTGEFIPKTIFRFNPNLWLKIFSPLLIVCYSLLYPIARVATILSIWILKLFKVNVGLHDENISISKVDLDYLVSETVENADKNEDIDNEVKIFQNALDFSSIKLRDCIVPRTEIIALNSDTTIEEITNTFVETGLSKILIYKDSIDNIIGYFHSSDLFRNPTSWQEYLRTMPIVPETMAANKLMDIFMRDKKSIAVVVDEFGGTAGIVTLEDIMEEIFGEIEDEHDTKEYVAKKLNDKEYLLSGRLEIDFINEQFDLRLPETDDYLTIAGFIMYHYQKIPQQNDVIRIENYTFRIIKARNSRIDLVKLSL
ncbi:MAG TPA: hemolysin family protein [Paludibacteraceae bacterium]|nr:hemolysin family protein [Paludibacteraceae bacterium]HOG36954.1 hemolysin family protein [Paludibacteraceae bacterium]HOH71777.1 hemolysin family protein [Paludibacteraceae bacterium]HOO24352.1 hemolysin family protein [Paludibacteraceae bacterium]HOS37790.1 hemolysin family protein [Paludibacteraceae bacterium]